MVVVIAATLAMLVAACRSGDSPSPSPPPSTPASVSVIDWVDFIRLGGITYLRAAPPSTIDEADVGPEFGRILFNVSENVTDPSYRTKNGDSARLDAGTAVYVVGDYAPSFRLTARRDGQLLLYEADSNPRARRGSDLLDISDRVEYIGIESAVNGRELITIDDRTEVESLVTMVLAAPVDQQNRDHDGPRNFVAFHLTDGTVVARSYWLDSGELHRGIMLPPQFRVAVEQALTGGSSR